MEPTQQNAFGQKNKILVILGILIAVIGASYYLFSYKPAVVPKFSDSVREARALCYEGRCDESVAELEVLIAGAASSREEVEAKTNLALSYLKSDIAKSMEIFKDIAANDEYSAARQAYAVEQIASLFMLSGQNREGTLPSLIFSGDPYASFVAGKPDKNNVPEGIRRLYEYSTEISSRPISEYRVAEWYARQAYYGKFDPKHLSGNISVKDYTDKILDRLQSGDAAKMQLFLGSLDEAYALWLKGYVMGLLADVTGESRYADDAKGSFAKSLELLRQYQGPSSDYKMSQILWMSFYYASFMANHKEYMDRTAMDELMGYLNDKNVMATRNPKTEAESNLKFGLMRYLERSGQIDSSKSRGVGYQTALSLAQKESRFADLLKTLGWEL